MAVTPQYKKLIKRAKQLGIKKISELDDLIGDEFYDEKEPISGGEYEVAKQQLRLKR
jgi:hypothetical protein